MVAGFLWEMYYVKNTPVKKYTFWWRYNFCLDIVLFAMCGIVKQNINKNQTGTKHASLKKKLKKIRCMFCSCLIISVVYIHYLMVSRVGY